MRHRDRDRKRYHRFCRETGTAFSRDGFLAYRAVRRKMLEDQAADALWWVHIGEPVTIIYGDLSAWKRGPA